MTPDRLRACLALLGWSGHGLARNLDCAERTVRLWTAGNAPVPLPIAVWLELLAAHHARHPPPDWRTRSAERRTA